MNHTIIIYRTESRISENVRRVLKKIIKNHYIGTNRVLIYFYFFFTSDATLHAKTYFRLCVWFDVYMAIRHHRNAHVI